MKEFKARIIGRNHDIHRSGQRPEDHFLDVRKPRHAADRTMMHIPGNKEDSRNLSIRRGAGGSARRSMNKLPPTWADG